MYYDLSVYDLSKETLALARRLGYTLVAAPGQAPVGREDAASGMRIVRRILIRGSSRREIARALAEARQGRVLVVVEPASMEAARYAAVNKNVHVIRVSPGMHRIIDRSTKRLFEERGWGAIEVTLRPAVLGQRGWMRYLYLSLRKAYSLDIPLITVSDARSKWELWHPRSIAGLAEAVGIPGDAALSWLTASARRVIADAGLD